MRVGLGTPSIPRKHTSIGHPPGFCAARRIPSVDAMTVIEVENLRKRYDDRPVVNGVSFAVEEGEIFGVPGPNGAGKTTPVECIAGLRTPDEGEIAVIGHDPRDARQADKGLRSVEL